MIRNILLFLAYLLLATLILSLEQAYGLPLVFLALVTLFTTFLGRWYRQIWLLLMGVLLASLYGFPLAGGVLLLLLLFGVWQATGSVLKNATLKLALVGMIGVGLLGLLIQFTVTSTTFLLLGVSIGVLVVVTRILIFIPETAARNSFITSLKGQT